MYLVISYCYDMFGNDTICQFEVSEKLGDLFEKYQTPTERHTQLIDNSEMDVFDLHYFKIQSNSEFNLHNSYLNVEAIEEILKSEKEDKTNDLELSEDTDNGDADDEYSDHDEVTEKKLSGMQLMVQQINDYHKKIYEILSDKSKTPEPDKMTIESDLNSKENRRRYRKLYIIKNRLASRYENIKNTGTYNYLLMYFDKGVVQSYERNGTESIKINGDEMMYSFKGKMDWSRFDYELFHHEGAHFILFPSVDSMITYVNNVLIENKNKYDNANVFFSKLISNKEYEMKLNMDNEIWLGNDKHPTITSPSRLTHNRFFDVAMQLVSYEKNVATYKSIAPIKESNHLIELECILKPTKDEDKVEDKDNYTDIPAEETLGVLTKKSQKYKLNHIRLSE